MTILVNQELFEEAVQTPTKLTRYGLLQKFINANNMAISPAEIEAIAKMVCALGCGNPSPDSLCAIINAL